VTDVTITVDERAVVEALRPVTRDEVFRRSLATMILDPRSRALFLVGLSRGEALGEAGVAAIGQEEVAALLHDLERQRLEEHGHSEGAWLLAHELCPEHFRGDEFRLQESVGGTAYYFKVREANRTRLRRLDRYSRLNLYLTTSFGYEVMVELLFDSVLDAVAGSTLSREEADRIRFVLGVIRAQEETHLGLVAQHNALLGVDRTCLGPGAVDMLERLERIEDRDYLWAAEMAVREIVPFMSVYAFPDHIARCVAERRCVDDPAEMAGLPITWPEVPA
jgi:hypothetical protein